MSEQQFHSHDYTPPKFFCPACGEKIREGIRYCGKCGTQLGSSKRNEYRSETAQRGENTPSKNMAQTYVYPEKRKDRVKFADFGDRLVAFIIDSVIVSLIISAIAGFIGLGISPFSVNLSDSWRWAFALPYFWVGAYYGQTLGKMIMHLETVHEQTYEQLSVMEAFLHVIGKVFFLPLDIFLAWIIEDQDEEEHGRVRITQRISKSVVIKTE